MQSHATRHFVSEHLKDLHPATSTSEAREVAVGDVTIAYGARQLPKLLAALEHQTDAAGTAHCLRVLRGVCTTQDEKARAILLGAAARIVPHINSADAAVASEAASALGQLTTLLQGQEAAVQHQGVEALTSAVRRVPVPAVRCLLHLAQTIYGVRAILSADGDVVAALSDAFKSLPSDSGAWAAKEQIVQAFGFICRHAEATPAALAAGVPAQVVGLAETTLSEDIPADVRLAVRYSCLDCMMQLCHDVRGMAAIREAGAVPVLAKLLHEGDGTTIGKALHTLMGLSIDVESKLEILQAAGERIVELLKSADALTPDVQRDCQAILANAAEHPAARALLDTQLPAGEQRAVLGDLPVLPFDYRHKVEIPPLQ